MNKYLVKIAEISEENKQVAKTFAIQSAANVPAHLLGGAIGGIIGKKHFSGATKSIDKGIGSAATAVSRVGGAGRWVGSQLHKAKGITGRDLGIGLGMAAAGGIADLAALKHGFHGKVKNNE